MQFLEIGNDFSLSSLANRIGDRNVSQMLITNNIPRVPNIGRALQSAISSIKQSGAIITPEKKISILNTFSRDSDIFEKAALLDEPGWQALSGLGTFENFLKVPEVLTLPDADDILGNGVGIGSTIYDATMNQIQNPPYIVDPSIFNEYSSTKNIRTIEYRTNPGEVYQWFKIPWGMVTLYSSLGGDSIDFPSYPEEISDGRIANYTQMPDMIYQYEPWYMYESSGPRQVPLSWHLHRHMWTGDHKDGKANELIRYCAANCYPEYNGSAVNSAIVTLYIAGKPFISGIMTSCDVEWGGPLADDGWYLEFTLKVTITEIAQKALSYSAVRNMPLIGG